MDVPTLTLLREHVLAARMLQQVMRPTFTDESAEPLLRAHAALMARLRRAEREAGSDRPAIRAHIEVSRKLMRLRARQFHFAYVDPDDGEGAALLAVPLSPLPPSLAGRAAESLPREGEREEER